MSPSFHQTFKITDNSILSAVSGACDAHILKLEKHFNVCIHARGGVFTVSGVEYNVQSTIRALSFLHDKAQSHDDIGDEDINTALQLGEQDCHGMMDTMAKAVITTPQKNITARSPRQAQYIQGIQDNTLCFGVGPAGTGKTYLAVAEAVAMLTSGQVDKIIITRPVVEAGENLGFLPGDLKEKVDPYLRPIYDSLYDCMPADTVHRKMETNDIEIAPLAYMRGRTLKNAFVILDEAQNTTTMQMKMFLTRLGQGSHMVITGDMSQIDLPNKQASGLPQAVHLLRHVNDISIHTFLPQDVVRHPLVGKIVQAYENGEGDTTSPVALG